LGERLDHHFLSCGFYDDAKLRASMSMLTNSESLQVVLLVCESEHVNLVPRIEGR